MIFQRHDLVFADWKSIDTSVIKNEDFRNLIIQSKIPGIVRRDEKDVTDGENYYTENEKVFIGFVHPVTVQGRRLRFGSSIQGNKITKLISPYEVSNFEFEARTPSLKALTDIRQSYNVGVWGSASLEIVTEYPYTHDMSDLDLIVKNYQPDVLIELLSKCNELESSFGIKIDVEIYLKNGYGINLKEYVFESDTLLGKGLRDVILIKRKSVEAYL